jgi:hypothetical protein
MASSNNRVIWNFEPVMTRLCNRLKPNDKLNLPISKAKYLYKISGLLRELQDLTAEDKLGVY